MLLPLTGQVDRVRLSAYTRPDVIQQGDTNVQAARLSPQRRSVMAEEVDEFWDAVKANNERAALSEVVQIAATALRFLVERQPMDKRNGAS